MMMAQQPNAYPHPAGMQHPGLAHGHPGTPGQPNPGQQGMPLGQGMPQQMHMSGPGGPNVSQAAAMAGMRPGVSGPPGGPIGAHALQHLNPGQAHQAYQAQQAQQMQQARKSPTWTPSKERHGVKAASMPTYTQCRFTRSYDMKIRIAWRLTLSVGFVRHHNVLMRLSGRSASRIFRCVANLITSNAQPSLLHFECLVYPDYVY
jgi:hypothetical protein